MVLQKLIIPPKARTKYFVPWFQEQDLGINSWFDSKGSVSFDKNFINTNKNIIYAEKIRIKPNNRQAKIIGRWFEICRIAYNHGLKYLKTLRTIKGAKFCSRETLRNIVKNNFSEGLKKIIKDSKIPSHTVSAAIFDVHKDYVSNFAKGGKFRIRYKKLGCNSSIVLEKSAFSKNDNAFAIRTLGFMQSTEILVGINKESRLVRTNSGYYVLAAREKPIQDSDERIHAISLDPGLRTFQTCYDSNAKVYEFCTNYREKIHSLFNKIHRISEDAGTKWHKKYTSRLYRKISNITDELHWKTINYLVKNFKNILIGNMSTISILKKKMDKSTKVLLQSMSHYTFRKRLEYKCKEYNCNFICVNESYTSKTCGHCGRINRTLGSKKIFQCPQGGCFWYSDRDHNAARNIMIRGLGV